MIFFLYEQILYDLFLFLCLSLQSVSLKLGELRISLRLGFFFELSFKFGFTDVLLAGTSLGCSLFGILSLTLSLLSLLPL